MPRIAPAKIQRLFLDEVRRARVRDYFQISIPHPQVVLFRLVDLDTEDIHGLGGRYVTTVETGRVRVRGGVRITIERRGLLIHVCRANRSDTGCEHLDLLVPDEDGELLSLALFVALVFQLPTRERLRALRRRWMAEGYLDRYEGSRVVGRTRIWISRWRIREWGLRRAVG